MQPRWQHVSILVAIASATSSSSSAQCPTWADGFGISGVDAPVAALTTFDDGNGPSLFVGGYFPDGPGDTSSPHCGRWDGRQWHGMSTGTSGSVLAWEKFDDGSGVALWAGGQFSSAGGAAAPNVARWSGGTWSAPASGPSGAVYALASFDDGSGSALYAGGAFTSAGPAGTSHIARWNGTSWSDVGGGVGGIVRALCVHDDGSGPALYAGGDFTTAGGTSAPFLARWDGVSWTSVGSGSNGEVYSLTVYDAGAGPRLVAGGHFDVIGGSSANYVAVWDGASWSPLGTGTNWIVYALMAFDDGSGPALYAGGFFNYPTVGLARWNGSTWSAVGGGVTDPVQGFAVRALSAFDAGSGPKLHAAGQFEGLGGVRCENIGRFDGPSWSSLGHQQGFDGVVSGFASYDAGSGPTLYAYGAFYHAGPGWAPSLVSWDGSAWQPVPGATYFGFATACVYDDGTGPGLYFGGQQSAGGIMSYIARWNGSTWSAVGGGIPDNGPRAMTVFDDGSGPALIVTGGFLHAGGTTAANLVYNIARWNGVNWSSVGGGFGGYGNALAVFDDGSGPALYVGGTFNAVGPINGTQIPASNIARWDGTSWSALGAGVSGVVNALAVFDDGSGPALYVAGNFASAGGAPAVDIARWNGSTWSSVGSGTNNHIDELAVFDDGSGPALYAGGNFASIDGLPTKSIARWNGSSWSAVGGGLDDVNDAVVALHAHDDGTGSGPSLWVGGAFRTIGGHTSRYVARWSNCGNVGTSFCSGDGSGTTCPCGNFGAPGNGCATSFDANGAHLSARGLPNVTNDTLVLDGSGTSSTIVTYFQGTTRQNGGAGSVFGDGLRCAGGSILRLGSVAAVGGLSRYPDVGLAPVSVRGLIPQGAGVRRTYQVWFRNAANFCTSSTFNLSNGLEVTWAP